MTGSATPTPHISAAVGDFAPTVLMPGDPLRARHIAETFFDDAKLVTAVRSMEGYTGTYQGVPVSVMGHGMGVPSVNIYATELVRFYGCKRLVRVGSCGGLQADLALRDVLVATAAGTDSAVNRNRIGGHEFPAVASFGLVSAAVEAGTAKGLPLRVGPVFTSDVFYGEDGLPEVLAAHGMLAIEMETAGLYGVAAAEGAEALSLLTVSDHLVTGESLPSEQRQTSFNEMVEVALAVAVAAAT